ncbi:alkylhydroperoxidase [Massilia sp. KIM]|uniref:carboxymuconolactone decarboxylase family protein n=1 Tax=Massilia sp. KIM TaxID=1955422 RepID=UPI00098EFF6F|nr:carboxymuconolactone decarboxylase family protein [Massilia sp. KIM]OON59474.1 alkylhydroperoxidase [Massilia sp. KIM]
MTRLYSQPVSDATGAAAQLFTAIKGAIGKVPNAYRDIGSNSPVTLESALTLDANLKKSTLSARDVEVIKLAVSETNGCDYCVAAHTLMGKMAGLSPESMVGVRKGEATGNAREDALAAFARNLVTTTGTVDAAAVQAVKAAGVTDAQIVDTTLAIAAITLTNLFNRINDTVLDFPKVD